MLRDETLELNAQNEREIMKVVESRKMHHCRCAVLPTANNLIVSDAFAKE